MLGAGFLWGRHNALVTSGQVSAQDDSSGPSEESQRKIQAANDALKVAMEGLKAESLYNPATQGMNVYGVLSGGLDAIDDLEAGRGVDPETFAGLYAGLALDDVQQHLSKDAEGRLTYKNKLVRIYPITRLKRQHAKRLVLTGEVQKTAKDVNE
ncbi:MAG: hypothetical protein B7Z55_09565 [Planctomycetales bacterium 12-60-4]|nr:MAG: hypothetical protein B7Z55_09565 [Planctomycetales bacterium 12-60-4]